MFERIRVEHIELNVRWKLYRRLYADSQRDAAVLESCGASVFAIFKALLFDDCLLRLCRMTDAATIGDDKTLSIGQLVAALPSQDLAKFEFDPQVSLSGLRESCSKIRIVRNNRIAHSNMEYSLATNATPLPEIAVNDVSSAIAHLSGLLNAIELRLRHGRTFYSDALVPSDESTDRLLALLRQSRR